MGETTVTPSCGCVFCDMGLEPELDPDDMENAYHPTKAGQVRCTMLDGLWRFTVTQGGVVVASGAAAAESEARSEAAHYGMMYAQDGPVVVTVTPPARL